METNFIVIDDFYANPDRIRKLALKAKYTRQGLSSTGYNGHSSWAPRSLVLSTMERIACAIEQDICYDLRKQAHFKVLTRKEYLKKTTFIHMDSCRWSAVICLNPPPQKLGYTSFWRQKKTGLYGFHNIEAMWEACRKSGLTAEKLGKGFHSGKISDFEEVTRIGYLFNRLIIFNGKLFHMSGAGFGTSPHNAKLTQTFFFESAPAKRSPNCSPKDWLIARATGRSALAA
jgi:hypothetical protein